ncbi:MAG: hypothetical protein PHH83_02265 [Patescibacteria group bacterium]|nr:hypothetical protein [Patescibacteria group bacterium]
MRFLKQLKPSYISIFCILFVAFFFIFNFVHALNDWTEPNADPPAGNIDLPLNQGAVSQYKSGSLTIGSSSIIEDDYYFKVLNGPALFENLDIYENGELKLGIGSQISLSDETSKINLSGGSTLNLNGGSINLSGGAKLSGVSNASGKGDIISVVHSGDGSLGSGIYSYAPSGGIAIDARTIDGTGIFASSTGVDSYSIYSVSNGGLAGRFDGRVIVYDSTQLKYVDLKDGHILAPFGFSTVINEAGSTQGNSVFQNNTVVTNKLCFSDIDASGKQTGNLECMTEIVGGPSSENSFIWNVGSGSDFSGATQTADMNLDGLISVRCNGDGAEQEPSKGIKIGDNSYIYDSSCGLSGGVEIPATLHVQSGETINIGSNPGIVNNAIVLKISNASTPLVNVLGSGKVGVGISAPEAILHLRTTEGNAEINIQSISSPKWGIYQDDTTDDLRFWNVDNRMTITNEGRLGIGTSTPEATLHLKTNDSNVNVGAGIKIQTGSLSKWSIYQRGTYGDPDPAEFGSLRFKNINDVMTITNYGNIGIGTTAPSARLDVAGSVNIMGSLYIGNNGNFLGKVEADGVCDSEYGDCLGGPSLKVGGIKCVNKENALKYSLMNWGDCYSIVDEPWAVTGKDVYRYPSIKNIYEPAYEQPGFTTGLFYLSGSDSYMDASANRFCIQLGYTGSSFVEAQRYSSYYYYTIFDVYWDLSSNSWKILEHANLTPEHPAYFIEEIHCY